MQTLLIVIGGIVGLIVVYCVYRYIATMAATTRAHRALWDMVAPVLERVKAGEQPVQEIATLSRDPRVRSLLYRVLRREGHGELFPKDQATPALIAESDLVAWLLHPNELDAVPDEIELVKEDVREEADPYETFRFFLFRFRTHAPHWAADQGWLAGLSGPYWDRDEMQLEAPGVFSRFEPFDSCTPDEHIKKIEETVLPVISRQAGIENG